MERGVIRQQYTSCASKVRYLISATSPSSYSLFQPFQTRYILRPSNTTFDKFTARELFCSASPRICVAQDYCTFGPAHPQPRSRVSISQTPVCRAAQLPAGKDATPGPRARAQDQPRLTQDPRVPAALLALGVQAERVPRQHQPPRQHEGPQPTRHVSPRPHLHLIVLAGLDSSQPRARPVRERPVAHTC